MKFSYQIIPEQRLSILHFSGSATIPEIVRHIQHFWDDSRYNPEFNGIVNMDGVTTRAKVTDLKLLVDFLETRKSSSGWWAAIFSEPKPMALALIFKATFAGTFKLEVVSNWEAACKFLKIDLPPGAALPSPTPSS